MKSNKEKIISNSVRLIAQKGFDAVSIRTITKSVGIKESSFYNHFPSKNSLLNEIFQITEENIDKLRLDKDELVELCSKLSLGEFLKKILEELENEWRKKGARDLWFVLTQQQYKNKRAAELIIRQNEKSIRMFEIAFQLFIDHKKMKPGDPNLLAMFYGYSMHAAHLKSTYNQFIQSNKDPDFSELYQIMSYFSDNYSVK